MRKGLYLLSIATLCGTIGLEAGGDIAANLTAVEPVGVKQVPIPVYIGGGFVAGRYFASNYEDVTYGTILRAGYEFNQYLGLEARYIGTYWDKGVSHGQSLEHFGLFMKPMLPMGEDINTYALFGYGWTKTKTTGKLNSAMDENGLSMGLGIEYDFSDKRDDYDPNLYYVEGFDGQADQEMGWGLFVDYQRLLIDSSLPDLDIVSAGVTYDF